MTLTLASMQFSPRNHRQLRKDRITQWTLGIFLGTFLYCMATLPAAHSLPRPFSPVTSVIGAILLAIICVGLLLFFINHISQAISVNHIVDRIASETEIVIDDVMPLPRRQAHVESGDGAESPVWETAILNDMSGYIRFVDTRRLLVLATSSRVKVLVVRRVGQFVPAGIPLNWCTKAKGCPPETTPNFGTHSISAPPEPFSRTWNSGRCRSSTLR